MMLWAGPLGTIHGHINLTQYENICIEYCLYINLKYSSTLRKIYILWIKICISLNLSVHFFFGNCSLRITLIFITFSMSEQLYGHKFFRSWFCRTWVVTWNAIYVSGIAGRDLCSAFKTAHSSKFLSGLCLHGLWHALIPLRIYSHFLQENTDL